MSFTQPSSKEGAYRSRMDDGWTSITYPDLLYRSGLRKINAMSDTHDRTQEHEMPQSYYVLHKNRHLAGAARDRRVRETCARVEKHAFTFDALVKWSFCFLVVLSTMATLPFLRTGFAPSFLRSNGNILLLCSIGLVAFLFSTWSRVKCSYVLRKFLPFALVGLFSTIGMAVLLSEQVGTLYGQTTLTAIVPALSWLLFDVLLIWYITSCYSHITSSFLDKVFNALLIIVLAVSVVQIGSMAGIPGFSSLFDLINVGDWFSAFETSRRARLTGVASEPAAMALTIGLFCIPFCYSKMVEQGGYVYKIAFALLLVAAFCTQSTTVYVVIGCDLIGICFLQLRKRKSKAAILAICLSGFALCIVAMGFLFFGPGDAARDTLTTFEDVLQKVTSQTHQSTAYRNSTIINDMEIFKLYPLFGVGDGNQGFFYSSNLPNWILSSGSVEVLAALSGAVGVLNGGAFIPSLLSGFGLVGCVLFAYWVWSCVHTVQFNRKKMDRYVDMFYLALFALAPICWMAIGFQGAPVAVFLILCLPTLGSNT